MCKKRLGLVEATWNRFDRDRQAVSDVAAIEIDSLVINLVGAGLSELVRIQCIKPASAWAGR